MLTVSGDIDLVRHLGHFDGESLLHLLHLLLVLRGGDERHRQTLGSEATSSSHAVLQKHTQRERRERKRETIS